MRSGINLQERLYALRRAKLLKSIRGEAALFPSLPITHRSRDQHHPYRQSSDLLYLTGIDEPEVVLLLMGSSRGARTILFMRERDPVQELWQGERIGIRRAKRAFQVDEVRDIDALEKDLRTLLSTFDVLHYGLGESPRLDRFVVDLLRTSAGPRSNAPTVLKDSRLLTSELRFIKDREEIRLLRHAADITATALTRIAPQLRNAKSELHAAKMIETIFAELGAQSTSFQTIVASGRNATELHHVPLLQPLWRAEPVLIDCGADFRGYAGDITRVFPVSSPFTGPVKAIYALVHHALDAAKKKTKPGATLNEIHQTVVNELADGLVSLKILRPPTSSVLSSERYKPYFPHKTSHWLGLDVHDIPPVSDKKHASAFGGRERPLVPGNAFTLEPGLYFHPEDDRVPKRFRGIGIRIEDSVIITDSGHEVLSEGVPSALEEIESLVGL